MKRPLLLWSSPVALLAVGLVFGPSSAGPTRPGEPDRAPRVPVVVELFTSEGCSSCPAADALLLELERTQPLAGVEVIALSEHVDYWNRLGWQDPFSAPAFTARQRQYAGTFHCGAYTPQAVVSGQQELVGSQRGALSSAILAAAKAPRAAIDLSLEPVTAAGLVPVSVRIEHTPAAAASRADVLLAVTETGLSSQVGRGENSGRLLHHPAVVRELRRLGPVAADGSFHATAQVALGSQWQSDHVRLVVLIQQQLSRRIVGTQVLALRP